MYVSGGGNVKNLKLNRFGPALRWMTYEAITAGLRMKPFENKKWKDIKPNDSLNWFWHILECIPFPRLSYDDEEHIICR
jgi:hypothetical protein